MLLLRTEQWPWEAVAAAVLLHAGEGEPGQGTDGRPGGAARQAAAARGLARGGQQAGLAKRHSSRGCSPGPAGRTKGRGWGCRVHGLRGRGAGVWPKAGEDDEHDVHGGARRKRENEVRESIKRTWI